MSTVKIQFTIEVPIKTQKRAKWTIASCSVLDIHSQGATAAQARSNLGEAISLFLVSCFERGTLDDVLKTCGFRAEHQSVKVSHKQKTVETLNVPIPFLVNSRSGLHTCHA